MNPLVFKAELQWWENNYRSIPQLPEHERSAVEDIYVHGKPLEEVAKSAGFTPQNIWTRLKHARVRVDREALRHDGESMQLTTDYSIVAVSKLGISLTRRLLNSVTHQQLDKLNKLLDKSPRWLSGVGVNDRTVESLESALAEAGLYLRGKVPPNAQPKGSMDYKLIR